MSQITRVSQITRSYGIWFGFPFNIRQNHFITSLWIQIYKPQICLLNFPFQVNLFKKISYLSQRVHKSVKFNDTLFARLVSGNNDVKNIKFVIAKHTMWQQQVSYFIWQLNWLVSIGFLWSMKSQGDKELKFWWDSQWSSEEIFPPFLICNC
jgi:hypothetical protein